MALHEGDEEDDGRQDAHRPRRRQRPVLDLLRPVLGDGHRQGLGLAPGEDQAVEELVVGEQKGEEGGGDDARVMLDPEVIVVLGGPEVSYETDQLEISQLADYVITGEGDVAFAALCRELLAWDRLPACRQSEGMTGWMLMSR